MGIVSPIGNNLTEYWEGLSSGRLGIGPITRFDPADFKVKVAAQVKGFDPTLYFKKSELRKTDLFTQYAVAAAVQAAEQSGIQGAVEPQRLGVYVGSGIGGISTIIAESEKMVADGPRHISPYLIPSMIGNIASGTIAIRTGAKGPCLPVVTACATSTHAIGEAFRAVAHGYADAILAGGAEAGIIPIAVAGFTSCMALTQNPDPTTACIPFDARRDGFVMGEGAAVLVLEEYDHARARGARIYVEVRGYGNTCDAYHITAPHPQAEGAARAITLALEESGIPTDALYINAHGTSTTLNDRAETLAFKQALGEAAYTAAISSTKSMTGHMLGAAGAAEAIACLLAMEHSLVPPTIGLTQPDPDCDLDYTPGAARPKEITAALSTSLGFGGHNACLAFSRAEQ